MHLILASTSPYRQRLLGRLQLPFTCEVPGVDEAPRPGETAPALAARLALAKAAAVADGNPEALVIGSDQVAVIDGNLLGKPGGLDAARAQLAASSNREVCFHTGVAVIHRRRGFEQFHVEPFAVGFRDLSATDIETYLLREQPYDCAGSFKCEGLGITLFRYMRGDDPTSLEGLPLIALSGMLATAGYPVLENLTDRRD